MIVSAFRIAARVVASDTWFHTTSKDLFDEIISSGLKKGEGGDNKWDKPSGDGIYLVKNMHGAKRFVDHLGLSYENTMIIEVVPPGKLLMDEDDVSGNEPDSMPEEWYAFVEKYPNAYKAICKFVDSGESPNTAKIRVIDEMQLAPDPDLSDSGQGGAGLTARYPGSISVSSIKKIYFLDEFGDQYVAWPKSLDASSQPIQ